MEIKIPAVGESITSALLAQWHKSDGDQVASGDLLLTIETDKVSSELTAEKDGVLKIVIAEGEEVAIGTLVGLIEEGKGSTPKKDAPKKEQREETKETSSKSKKKAPKAETKAPELKKEATPTPIVPVSEEKPKPKEVSAVSTDRETRKKLSPLRRKIAAHLQSAQHEAAILSTFNEADMSAIMKLRKEVQETFIAKHGIKLGFMSFFLKAVMEALKDVPAINSRLEGDILVTNHYYDIGVAVGTEKGLVVPVVRDCDQKSFAQIEQDISDYAGKAREGKINLDDLQRGCFTVSNGGIYGSLLSTPILNPPQSGILGMHTIQKRPVAVGDEVQIRPMMYLALSYDHRVVDGKEAVTFLIRVKDCIENPARLLVGA